MKIAFCSIPVFKIFLIFFLLSTFFTNAQEDSEILDVYEDYTEAAREVVYMHLNKSTYIKGESVGFTAYVMDKKDKKPSLLTTNLYVNIADEQQNVLKQKLIKVFDGVASNTFELDSTFTSGYYTIKAYTNWMLNFEEQNYYAESIRIIDPENEEYVQENLIDNKIDAQFLPESGHLLHGVINNIGVVIKDHLGYGIPNAKGEIVDKNNKVLSSFETNQFGIGKFQLLADFNNTYKVNLNHANEDFSLDLNQKIDFKGIIMSLNRLKSKVFVSLITNDATLETLKNKRHTLMIHNGNNYDIMDVYFTDDTLITKAIDYNNTASGINILTLFNENDQPIAERLFFNYEGINIIKSNDISATRTQDSVNLTLNFKGINTTNINSLSVSILPKETAAYNSHNNLVSHTFLQPYINGLVEQGKYYFTDIDAKKQYELDNLLVTQGWSSYNWNTIFNTDFNQSHTFEQGIRIKANLNTKEANKNVDSSYLMYAVSEEEPRVFEVGKDEHSFIIDNLFPVGAQKLSFSKMTKLNGLIPAALYLQYFPSAIPSLNVASKTLNPKHDYRIGETMTTNNTITFDRADKVQRLDQVVVKSRLDKKRQRIEKLNEGRFGRISIVDEDDRLLYNTLANYLISKGFYVDDSNGQFSITDRFSSAGARPGFGLSNASESGPAIFLDDLQLIDASFLTQYSLTNVDYIEINRRGFGEGLRGGNGTIRIYSNKAIANSTNNWDSVQEFDIPLAFSEEKQYYVPKYQNTGDSFYKAYGVVDWKPHLKINENGNVTIKIERPRIPITLYIEGIANDGSYIFEEKSITLD